MKPRRGVAMLLTVLTMTVLLAAVSIIARSRTTERLMFAQDDAQQLADDLIRASEQPIRQWLEEKASKGIVLPSDVAAPMVPVFDYTVRVGETDARVRVTAWDQQGMWPSNANAIGLDGAPDLGMPDGIVIAGLDVPTNGARRVPSFEYPDALGGLVATHNPWPSRGGTTRSRGGAVININTAPRALLGQFFSVYRLGDVSEVLAQRDRGELAMVTISGVDPKGERVRAVSISRVWSIRIDAWVGRVQRSCWCVYANQGGSWVLSQRVVIHD